MWPIDPDEFTSIVGEPEDLNEAEAWFFLFIAGEIVSLVEQGIPRPLTGDDLRWVDIDMHYRHYLGRFQGRDCFAAEASGQLPEGYRRSGLRGWLGRVDPLKKSVLDLFRDVAWLKLRLSFAVWASPNCRKCCLQHDRLAPSFARGRAPLRCREPMPCKPAAAYCKVLAGNPLKPCNFHAGNSTRSIYVSYARTLCQGRLRSDARQLAALLIVEPGYIGYVGGEQVVGDLTGK